MTRGQHGVSLAVVSGLATLVVWGFLAARKESGREQERERPVEAPNRVVRVGGESVVRLDAGEQERAGIQIAKLGAATSIVPVMAFATVVDLQSLADLQNTYAAAKAQAEKSQASLQASRREYQRLKTLHEQDQIVSTQALDAAEASFVSDEAGARAAEVPLRTVPVSATQEWGPVISRWIVEASPDLARLMSRQDVLLQVTLPPDTAEGAPPSVVVRAPGGPEVAARFVSPAPRTDPRIQGRSFVYVALAEAHLLAGMNVSVSLGGAAAARGALVPAAAIVWWRGKAWVYVRGDEGFVRHEVSTTRQAPGGYVVTELAPGVTVVVRGAQVLLSEEFRSQVQLGEGQER